jgi:hypothetical protein
METQSYEITIPSPVNKLVKNMKYNNYIPIKTKTHLSFKKPECRQVLNDKCCIKPQENEYSLTNHFFDPNHQSPPNDFLLKLQSRMDHYYKKESNLFNE